MRCKAERYNLPRNLVHFKCQGSTLFNLHVILNKNNNNWVYFFFFNNFDMTTFLFDLQHLNIKTLTDDVVRQLKFRFGCANK